MKYTLIPAPRPAPAISFEQFATQEGLEMIVRESSPGILPRYRASFHNSDVKDGRLLIAPYGGGDTPEEAIEACAEKLRGTLLILDAYGPDRREIQCPEEWGEE